MMNLRPVIPPAVSLPLNWANEIKGHLRLDSDDERARVESVLVPAAVNWIESYTGRALMQQTWQLFLDCFPSGEIILPKAPLQSVTHIKYYNTAGTLTTLDTDEYIVDPPAAGTRGAFSLPGRITPAYGYYWPATQARISAVEIQFVCGYGDESSEVPGLLRAAMLLHIGEQFERRESAIAGTNISEVPQSAKALAGPFRLKRFA